MRQLERRMVWISCILIASAVCGTNSSASLAKYKPNFCMVPTLSDSWVVDGRLDDEVWEKAPRFSGLVRAGGECVADSETEISLFSDGESLCVAFLCHEATPSEMLARYITRDSRVWDDDSVEIFIQGPWQTEDYFHFVLNTRNVLCDEHMQIKEWNANIETETYVGSTFWSAEFRIPIYELGGAFHLEMPFKANFVRNRQNPAVREISTWSLVEKSNHDIETFGTIMRTEKPIPGWKARIPNRFYPGRTTVGVNPGLGGTVHAILGCWPCSGLLFISDTITEDSDITYTLTSDTKGQTFEIRNGDSKFGELLYRSQFPVKLPKYHSLDSLKKLEAKIAKDIRTLPKAIQARFIEAHSRDAEELRKLLRIRADEENLTLDVWNELEGRAFDLEIRLNNRHGSVQARKKTPDSSLVVGLCSSMLKVFIRDRAYPGQFTDRWKLQMARGEREAFQVSVLATDAALSQVRVIPGEFRSGNTLFPKENISVSLVGYVLTRQPSYEVEYVGWWPDPLLDFQETADARHGETLTFWVEFHAPESLSAGNYSGSILVQTGTGEQQTVGVDVEVWDFLVKPPFQLPTAFAYPEVNPQRIHGSKWNSAMRQAYWDAHIENGIDIDQLYRPNPPSWDDIDRMLQMGARNFNLLYLNRSRINEDTLTFNEAEMARVLKILLEMVPELRRRGLMDKVYLYAFDEAPRTMAPAIQETLAQVKALYPDLRTMTTAYDETWGQATGLADYVDIWVPLTPKYNLKDALALRAKGKDMWWYICIGPRRPHANWFIEYEAIEPRLLTGAMSAKYDVTGFLYYNTARWPTVTRAIETGPYTNWDPASYKINNGDGSLFCAGPDGPVQTIRVKNIRDGFEDFEYHYQLKTLLAQKRSALSARDIKAIESLLSVPASVVKDLTTFTRDPDQVYQWRAEMARWILRLQAH